MISTKVPNIGGKIVQDTIQVLGLNLSENRQTGELAESSGISTEFYPTLQQRKGRSVVFRDAGTPYGDPTQVWEWDGKLLVVDEGSLYYDGFN